MVLNLTQIYLFFINWNDYTYLLQETEYNGENRNELGQQIKLEKRQKLYDMLKHFLQEASYSHSHSGP